MFSNERHFRMGPFGGQLAYTPNVHIVNDGQDNVADQLGRIGFSSCKIVGPIFKSTGALKRMKLIPGFEALNAIAGAIGKGFWPTMQVMVRN